MFPLLPLWGLRSILQKSSAEQSLKFEAVNDTDKKQITETPKCEEFKRKLRTKYIYISNGMIRTADIVAKLFQSEVLTATERDEIQNLSSIPVKASEQLLNALMSKDDRAYDCFLTALIETDQKHITNILQNEDKYLDNEHSHMIRRHYFTLVDQLDVDSGLLIDRLLQSGALVFREVATIKAKPTRHEKTEMLLDLVSKFSTGNFDKFLQALKESNHEHVISIMKDKRCINIDGKIESEGFTSATDESKAQFKESSVQEETQKIPALQSLTNRASSHKQQDNIRRGEDFRISLLTMKRTSIRTLGSRFGHLPDELQTDVSLKVATLHQETVLPYASGVDICYRKLVEGFILKTNEVNRKQTEVKDMREIVRRVNDTMQNSVHQFKEGFSTESHILSEEIQLHRINRHLDETLKTTVVDLGNEKQKRKELETQLEQFQNESEKFEALLIEKDGMLSQFKHTQEQDAKVWADEKDQLIVQMQELQKKYSECKEERLNLELEMTLVQKEKYRLCEEIQEHTRYIDKIRFRLDPIFVKKLRTKATKEKKRSIGGLAILGNELFVVSQESLEVEVYDSIKLSFSRRWSLGQLVNPIDMASCNQNKCLYLSNYKDYGWSNEVLRVDPNGTLICMWSTGDDVGCSLSVTDESNVILTIFDKNKLLEYSPNGLLILEINLSVVVGIRSPWRAAKLANGHFLVSYKSSGDDADGLCLVDSGGNLKKSFVGKRGSIILQVNSPVYFSVDENDFVLVIDQGNRRVLLLDSDLNFKQEILSKRKHNLRYPWRVIQDYSNGRLFVADNESCKERILIFDFK